jgi:hypothetical protein
MVMWFVGTKKAYFRGIKGYFLGLAA